VRFRHLIAGAAAVAVGALTGPVAARADSGFEPMRVGGIDVERYCHDNYGVDENWFTELFGKVQVTTHAFVDGRGPNEAYHWKCLMFTSATGLSDYSWAAYEAAESAWSPDDGPGPRLGDFVTTEYGEQDFPLDMNSACVQQYGAGSWAQLTNADDMTSWKCYVMTVVGVPIA
jgi:hypothetical protein